MSKPIYVKSGNPKLCRKLTEFNVKLGYEIVYNTKRYFSFRYFKWMYKSKLKELFSNIVEE